MNEYIVSVYITENHNIKTTLLVKAKDKDEAEKKAIEMCHEEGLKTYGTDFCDWCG